MNDCWLIWPSAKANSVDGTKNVLEVDQMGTRRKLKMRRLINVTLEAVAQGEIHKPQAALQLLAVGVPVSVIGRVLGFTDASPLNSETVDVLAGMSTSSVQG